jgi:tRNA C32,U32 (ribose-2'-O)-methylase TrmJ
MHAQWKVILFLIVVTCIVWCMHNYDTNLMSSSSIRKTWKIEINIPRDHALEAQAFFQRIEKLMNEREQPFTDNQKLGIMVLLKRLMRDEMYPEEANVLLPKFVDVATPGHEDFNEDAIRVWRSEMFS